MLVDAVSTIIPPPTMGNSSSDSQTRRESEKPTRPMPNAIVARTIARPSPSTELRDARYKAPANAPSPDAVIRNPSVCGPPWRTPLAIAGISTVYGIPMVLTSARSKSADRIGTDCAT